MATKDPRQKTRKPRPPKRRVSRRDFLRGAAGAAGAVALGVGAGRSLLAATRGEAVSSGTGDLRQIRHLVVVMMENRSFDHYLGWRPGADGRQAGLTYPDREGNPRPTYHLAPDYMGCPHPGPDHSYAAGRLQFNNGACNGWLRAEKSDEYAIGYYTEQDLGFYAGAALDWTVCDRYFAAIMGPTWPNKIYQFCGQTDRLANTNVLCTLPTIFDRLAERGVSHRYYFSDVPFVALWGTRYLGISRPFAQFEAAAAAGSLPSVSFVDPRFLGARLGLSCDDHPHADVRCGQDFLNRVYEAVTSGPDWPETALVINYDEWGGFFDHVPPSRVGQLPPADRAVGSDGLRGFRVPAIVISPWSRGGAVSHTEFDHTSILKLIRQRWNTRPLTIRDKNAKSLAQALDLTSTNTSAPIYTVPPGPFTDICPPDSPGEAHFEQLLGLAAARGFPVP